MWYTYFFWFRWVEGGSIRYLAHAIIIHAIWLGSFVVISLPLYRAWQMWVRLRQEALIEIFTTADQEAEHKVKVIDSTRPVPIWNLVGSTVTGIVVVGVPFVSEMLSR